MRIGLKVLVILFTMFALPVYSGEVTDKEFNLVGDLIVTYYHGANGEVNCTAFNQQGKAIGGGMGIARGGVARIRMQVPKKYIGKELKVSCK